MMEKTKRGRKPQGEEAMTNAEKQAAYRARIRENAGGYSGKALSLMLSGDAHMALDVIREERPELSYKEIVEMLLIKRVEESKPGYFHLPFDYMKL
jgi:hypothetical protein